MLSAKPATGASTVSRDWTALARSRFFVRSAPTTMMSPCVSLLMSTASMTGTTGGLSTRMKS